MPTLSEFLAQQEEVYENFRNAAKEVHEKGIGCDPDLKAHRGGFFVNLRHAPEVERAAGKFSRQISKLIPAIVYEKGHIHTTLGSYGSKLEFRADPKNVEHSKILSALSRGAYSAVRNLKSAKPLIDYGGYLYSRYVAIAMGVPDQGFVDLAGALSVACAREGLELKPPWGAHMTLSRFTGAIPAGELGPFFELFETSPPLGSSAPVAVEIGYADWSEESRHGHFMPYATIPF